LGEGAESIRETATAEASAQASGAAMSDGVLIFDTEQTDRKNGEIIEAAWLRLQPGADIIGPDPALICRPLAIAKRFCERYKPSKPTTFGALAVHSILPSELEQCQPSSEFKLPDDTAYIVAHNADFDWKAAGAPPAIKRIDTCAIAEHLWPDADSHGQVALIYMLLGATESTRDMVRDAHSALADVHLNLALLGEILNLKPEITTWAQLHAFSEECRVPLFCPFKRWEGQRLEEMDDGAINWCLNQSFVHAEHPYLVIGLKRVMAKRYPPFNAPDDNDSGKAF